MSQSPSYQPSPYQGQSTPIAGNLAQETLSAIDPAFKHGLKEISITPLPHAIKEAAAVSYLIGRGYDYNTAHNIVESWWKMGYY
jgi:hypothetical protein